MERKTTHGAERKTTRKTTGTAPDEIGRKTTGSAPDDFEAHALSVVDTEKRLGADKRLSERKHV